MIKKIEIAVAPEMISDESAIVRKVSQYSGCKQTDINTYQILKKSIDARRDPVYRLSVEVFTGDDWPVEETSILSTYRNVAEAEEVLIIGAGPAGYFAALECIANGLKPVVIERGKDVQTRRRDLKAIHQEGIVNPNSNYCFGEGGAGTYSDGKLYTRSKKRGHVKEILKILVEHGAHQDILIDAHPHIGSNKLPAIIASIRETILQYGGEVRFDSLVTDFLIEANTIIGVQINRVQIVKCSKVVLATGHSARDIYHMLDRHGVAMEEKAFALGVRIEHKQGLIDKLQYGTTPKSEHLPAASYRLSTSIAGTGVYTFCMCPGGMIVPAATAPGELVVNGMSLSRRDSPYANAGLVVSITPGYWKELGFSGVLGGVDFQMALEKTFYAVAEGSQRAPAQRLMDFVRGVPSSDLPSTSYIPGLLLAPVHELIPESIYRLLVAGIMAFEKKMPGYLTNEAVVVGLESRTSSPVRIPRDDQSLMHTTVSGLYPTGEGAGYAGGIISAAIDGRRVIQSLANL